MEAKAEAERLRLEAERADRNKALEAHKAQQDLLNADVRNALEAQR